MKNRKLKNLIFIFFTLLAVVIIFTRTRELVILDKLSRSNVNINTLYETRLILNENELLLISLNNLIPSLNQADGIKEMKMYSNQAQTLITQIESNFQLLGNIKKIKLDLKDIEFFTAIKKIQNLFLIDFKKKYLALIEKEENKVKLGAIYTENDRTKIEIEEPLKESINLLNAGLTETYVAMSGEFQKVNKIIEENNTYINKNLTNKYSNSRAVGILILLSLIILFIIVSRYVTKLLISPIKKIQSHLDRITLGELPEVLELTENLEHNQIASSLNKVVAGLRKGAEFSEQIGKGNFDMKYKLLSEKDVLGTSLLALRDNLQDALSEEEKRKKEDEQRNRTNVGLTLFAEILRQHPENLELLADTIISSLVKFLNANQGALFFLNEDDKENIYYELIGAYAYDRKKFLTKHIKPGEGLVGAVAIEKYTVYMTDVPDEYVEIESGTGSANPHSILIIPLKIEDKVPGVIELASFHTFEKYEIDMAEKIAQSIASSLANTAINMQTKVLLEKSKDMEKAVLEQEKELIQNNKEIRDLKKKLDDLMLENEKLKKTLTS